MKQKPLIILILILLFWSSTALAQKHGFALKGGIVSSGMSMDYKGTADPQDKPPQFNRIIDLYFSLGYGYNFLGKFYLNTGLEFYNKGAQMLFDTSHYDMFRSGTSRYQTHVIEKLTYLSVPISISRQIHLDKNGRHRVILAMGINFSYMLKATANGYSVVDFYPNGSIDYDRSEQTINPIPMTGYFKWDFSMHVGGGYRFQLNEDLGFGIDYRFLSNFYNVNETRLRYEYFDSKSGSSYLYSPGISNQDNHILSLGVFISPGLFLGLEKKQSTQ